MDHLVHIVDININETTLLQEELTALKTASTADANLGQLIAKINIILQKLPINTLTTFKDDDDEGEILFYNENIPIHIQRLHLIKQVLTTLSTTQKVQSPVPLVTSSSLIEEQPESPHTVIEKEQTAIISPNLEDTDNKITTSTQQPPQQQQPPNMLYIETFLNEIEKLTQDVVDLKKKKQDSEDQISYFQSLYYINQAESDQWKAYANQLEKEIHNLQGILFDVAKQRNVVDPSVAEEYPAITVEGSPIAKLDVIEESLITQEFQDEEISVEPISVEPIPELQLKEHPTTPQENIMLIATRNPNPVESELTPASISDEYKHTANEIIQLSKQMLLEAHMTLASKDEELATLRSDYEQEVQDRRETLLEMHLLRETLREVNNRNAKLTADLNNMKTLNTELHEKLDATLLTNKSLAEAHSSCSVSNHLSPESV